MNNELLSIHGLPRRMVLQGLASLLGGAFTPSAFAAVAKSCRLTERDIIGPFYRFGAPFQTKLAGPNEPGERLIITGKVYSSDCRSRLPNTLIEVWQANQAGLYDTNKPGNFTEHAARKSQGQAGRFVLLDESGEDGVSAIQYSLNLCCDWAASNRRFTQMKTGLRRLRRPHRQQSRPRTLPVSRGVCALVAQ